MGRAQGAGPVLRVGRGGDQEIRKRERMDPEKRKDRKMKKKGTHRVIREVKKITTFVVVVIIRNVSWNRLGY